MLYFDNAATTFPKPIGVLNAVQKAVTYYGGNPGRAGHDMSMRVSEQIYSVRDKLAALFNAESQNVIFTSNCTASLNMAIKGLHNGGKIICSSLEHNSVIRPIYNLYEKGLAEYEIMNVGKTDEDVINSFHSLIDADTEMLVCTHASNLTGRTLPIEALGKICHKHGITFIVDAAQSAGVLPINIKQCHIDALCMPGHKGLLGITGTGVLILKGDRLPSTLFEGGTGSASAELVQPDFLPDRLESGTANTVGILSVGAGLDFIKKRGMGEIYRHESAICNNVYNRLHTIKNVVLYEERRLDKASAPIVSFNIMGADSNAVAAALNRAGIAVRSGMHCAPLAHEFYGTKNVGMVRFSPGAFTKESEAAAFINNVELISKNIAFSLEKL